MPRLLHLLLITVTIITSAIAEFSGTIRLYRDIDYRHNLALFEFTKSNRCFNVACGNYNDAISSVKWSGLPTTASYDGSSNAKVVFYVNADCKGKSKSYSTSLSGVKSFVDEGINDAISSFMVLESSESVENGIASLCSLSRTLSEHTNGI
ncbi:hypothetical protein F442_12727 [Phytophthora nicotianae P10297]|uniref:Uncharacterized protein n=1 Tax=Phytophthora nicotianae P10297 TaxID=1317064 RepID=W2YYR3_PHYNI|nr:hypothetical protein F442_12727 [Phytophthora nicotianae P10297]